MSTKHYRWRGHNNTRSNFGDELGPLLLQRFADIESDWSPIAGANVITVGSILDLVPTGWRGIVLGAGKLREPSQVDLSKARVLALRGPLTAAQVNARPGYVLGDPGLLADELVPVPEKTHNLGIVPHWSDTTLETRKEFLKYDPLIIHSNEPPLEVIRKIGSCRKIVASSLHGLIIADAFGIPRRTELTEQFGREGGTFKFEDYNATVGVEFKVGVTQDANRFKVTDRQHELYDMFEYAGQLLRGHHR